MKNSRNSALIIQRHINFVNEIYKLYPKKNFQFGQVKDQLIKFKVHNAFMTHLCKVGALHRYAFGIYGFIEGSPSNQSIEKAYLSFSQRNQNSVAKSRSKNTSFNQQSELTKKLIPITEPMCIQFLKERGYRIQKIKVEYEEV